jgi:hypothetical protein
VPLTNRIAPIIVAIYNSVTTLIAVYPSSLEPRVIRVKSDNADRAHNAAPLHFHFRQRNANNRKTE